MSFRSTLMRIQISEDKFGHFVDGTRLAYRQSNFRTTGLQSFETFRGNRGLSLSFCYRLDLRVVFDGRSR